MYEYKGNVTRVVDGDTVDADLDLGFGITMSQRFRLDHFDAPELWHPRNEAERFHAEKATKRAEELLMDKELIFQTTKTAGIFGRYGAKIILPDGSDFSDVMIQEGFQKKENY